MKIKKISQSIGVLGKILNTKSTSTENTYSCDYINKLDDGYVLYENSKGNNADIVLNDSISNYNYLEIYYTTSSRGGSRKISASSSSVYIDATLTFSYYVVFRTVIYTLSDKNISIVPDRTYTCTLQSSGLEFTQKNEFYITKVIGYK